MSEGISSGNAGYAFYIDYLKKTEKTEDGRSLNDALLKGMNNASSMNKWISFGREKTKEILNYIGEKSDSIPNTYKICYPGLLVGSGYPHMPSSEKCEGAIQNGFLFDYTTGAPYIPGSSIKGVIADVFQRAVEGRAAEKEGFRSYIISVLGKEYENAIDAIWENSFRGEKWAEDTNKEYEPISNRDLFFDAYIVGVAPGCKSIMGTDNITPHKYVKEGDMKDDFDLNHMPLFEPKPITVLRVMPGTVFSINIKKTPVKVNGEEILSAEAKEELYFQILKDFGVGGKTNLGYGNIEKIDEKIINSINADSSNDSGGKKKHSQRENDIQKNNTGSSERRCIKCGRSIKSDHSLCDNCYKEAPVCKSCNKNKLSWNKKSDKWFSTCLKCSKKS